MRMRATRGRVLVRCRVSAVRVVVACVLAQDQSQAQSRLRLFQFQAPDDYRERCSESIREHTSTAGIGVSGVTHGDLWTTCELAGGQPPSGADNCLLSVDIVWMLEKPEIIGCRLLRGVRGGSKNALTVGNGHHLGATLGTWEEPGNRSPARMPGTGGGARRQQSQATGRTWRGDAWQGPPSHTWGALLDSARQERLLLGPARRQSPECLPR